MASVHNDDAGIIGCDCRVMGSFADDQRVESLSLRLEKCLGRRPGPGTDAPATCPSTRRNVGRANRTAMRVGKDIDTTNEVRSVHVAFAAQPNVEG